MANKVKTYLSNGKTAGEKLIGSFIRLDGENFWRRVNSDGSLTLVGDGTKGTYDYKKTAGKVRNDVAKSLKIKGLPTVKEGAVGKILSASPLVMLLDATGLMPKVQNYLIRNTSGVLDWKEALIEEAIAPVKQYYYDGSRHDDYLLYDTEKNKTLAPTSLTTNRWNTNHNIVNLYTHQDDTGFTPSTIGAGSYSGDPEFGGLPAYEGNFYGSGPIYLPTTIKLYFDKNIGKMYYLDLDKLVAGEYLTGLDDVQHHRATPRKYGDKYLFRFEDVWDVDSKITKHKNYPFILNLDVDVVFTDDEEKLKRRPGLIKWFSNEDNWK